MQYFASLSLLATSLMYSNIVARLQNFIQKLSKVASHSMDAQTHKKGRVEIIKKKIP